MVLVSNLSRNVKDEALKEIFGFFGVLSSVSILYDEKNNNLPL